MNVTYNIRNSVSIILACVLLSAILFLCHTANAAQPQGKNTASAAPSPDVDTMFYQDPTKAPPSPPVPDTTKKPVKPTQKETVPMPTTAAPVLSKPTATTTTTTPTPSPAVPVAAPSPPTVPVPIPVSATGKPIALPLVKPMMHALLKKTPAPSDSTTKIAVPPPPPGSSSTVTNKPKETPPQQLPPSLPTKDVTSDKSNNLPIAEQPATPIDATNAPVTDKPIGVLTWHGSLMFTAANSRLINDAAQSSFKKGEPVKIRHGTLTPKPESTAPVYAPSFYLNTLLYSAPDNWTIWINNKRITSANPEVTSNLFPTLQIVAVTDTDVTFLWEPRFLKNISPEWSKQLILNPHGNLSNEMNTIVLKQDKSLLQFTLRPNQTFTVYDMQISEGYIPPTRLTESAVNTYSTLTNNERVSKLQELLKTNQGADKNDKKGTDGNDKKPEQNPDPKPTKPEAPQPPAPAKH